ncbi:MAG: hypothetical protein PF480_05415 [Roseovarius sp.]|nr:hypothetical protein [Roseovarius sp.]
MTDTIGTDISKATLDVHRLSTGEAAQFSGGLARLAPLDRVADACPRCLRGDRGLSRRH